MAAIALLASTFALVFFLGLQSLVVNSDHRAVAFANSFMIGLSQLALYKLAPDANGMEIAAYLCGGPFGIVASMMVFRWWKRRAKTIVSSEIEHQAVNVEIRNP